MKNVPYPLCILSGAIGKKIVVKKYRSGTIITKYPEMKNIIASEGQRKCRNLFKEAVAFAKNLDSIPETKKEFLKKVPKGKSVYNMAIKEYMGR